MDKWSPRPCMLRNRTKVWSSTKVLWSPRNFYTHMDRRSHKTPVPCPYGLLDVTYPVRRYPSLRGRVHQLVLRVTLVKCRVTPSGLLSTPECYMSVCLSVCSISRYQGPSIEDCRDSRGFMLQNTQKTDYLSFTPTIGLSGSVLVSQPWKSG